MAVQRLAHPTSQLRLTTHSSSAQRTTLETVSPQDASLAVLSLPKLVHKQLLSVVLASRLSVQPSITTCVCLTTIRVLIPLPRLTSAREDPSSVTIVHLRRRFGREMDGVYGARLTVFGRQDSGKGLQTSLFHQFEVLHLDSNTVQDTPLILSLSLFFGGRTMEANDLHGLEQPGYGICVLCWIRCLWTGQILQKYARCCQERCGRGK